MNHDAGVRAELDRLRGGDIQRARTILNEFVGVGADGAG